MALCLEAFLILYHVLGLWICLCDFCCDYVPCLYDAFCPYLFFYVPLRHLYPSTFSFSYRGNRSGHVSFSCPFSSPENSLVLQNPCSYN